MCAVSAGRTTRPKHASERDVPGTRPCVRRGTVRTSGSPPAQSCGCWPTEAAGRLLPVSGRSCGRQARKSAEASSPSPPAHFPGSTYRKTCFGSRSMRTWKIRNAESTPVRVSGASTSVLPGSAGCGAGALGSVDRRPLLAGDLPRSRRGSDAHLACTTPRKVRVRQQCRIRAKALPRSKADRTEPKSGQAHPLQNGASQR